ncbi:MAG: COQ9 family protein [Rhodospirillaceae bacterium]|nr:COQ9 family protein [Rhodospirillaceae bacterium]
MSTTAVPDKQARRDALVMAALKHVPFDGWTMAALQRAATDAGQAAHEAEMLFAGGVPEAVAHFVAMADRLMVEDYAKLETAKLKHREKIAGIVRARLERWTPHREAVRRALALSPMPSMAGRTLKGAYATVDTMWKAVGDKSIDFSFYTKRALLAGVYGSTLLFWLEDRSEGCAATWAFLDRRIDNVMQVPKLRSRITERLEKLPTPGRALAKLTGLRSGRRTV